MATAVELLVDEKPDGFLPSELPPVKLPTASTIQRTYKVSACIDWIRLTITTEKPTQFQWIQAELKIILNLPDTAKAIYVKPLAAGAGGAAHQFNIVLHDYHANSYAELSRIMIALERKFPFAAQAKISGIEISLDFLNRCVADGIATLRSMTYMLQSCIAVHGNARQYNPTNHVTTILGGCINGRIDPDHTFYVGNKSKVKESDNDPVTHRVYLKVTDHNKQPIPENEWRARAEFTLIGLGLVEHGLTSLESLNGYRFEGLAGLLHFRTLKTIEEITAGKNLLFTYAVEKLLRGRDSVAALSFGWIKFERYPNGKPRHGGRTKRLKYHRHSVADSELNALVRKKLMVLSKTYST